MNKMATLVIAFATALAVSMAPAFANVINIGGGAATVTCKLSCDAFTLGGPPGAPTMRGVLSSTIGDQYTLHDSNVATEAAALKTLIGVDLFSGTGVTQVNTGNVMSHTFMTMAEYIVLKIADTHVFLFNTAMNEITVDYLQTGPMAGISHYTEFGQVLDMPIPSSIWLMAAGLAGLGFAGRIRKAKA